MSQSLISLMNATPRRQRLVAAAIGLTAAGLIVMLLLLALSRLSDMRSGIQALREELFQIQTIVARARQQVADPLPRTDATPLFIAGDSLPVVEASLYQLLNSTAQSSGAAITSISSTPAPKRSDLHYVAIRMDIEGTIAAVHETIQRIEATVPAMIVEKAQLRATSGFGSDAVAGPVTIAGQLTILGALDPSVQSVGSAVQ